MSRVSDTDSDVWRCPESVAVVLGGWKKKLTWYQDRRSRNTKPTVRRDRIERGDGRVLGLLVGVVSGSGDDSHTHLETRKGNLC